MPPGQPTSAQVDAWQSLSGQVEVRLRPVASPTSLGLFGLAAATLTLAGLQLGWVAPSEGKHVAIVLVAFAAMAQLVSSIIAFGARDGTVATVMGVLSLTWLSVGLVMFTSPPGSRSPALGLFLLLSGIALVLSGVTAALSKVAASMVFVTAGLRIALTGAYHLSGADWVQSAAGLVGLLLFLMAVYVAFASELEDATGSSPLPLGRRGKGREAMHGSLMEQAKEIATEPGVRKRL